MTKPIIKVGFTDYFPPVDEFFTELLSNSFTVVRDDNDPEYLFFCDETFGTKNLSYDETKVTKIFYTGENRRPWNYRCHHAVSFDHLDGPQFFRLPLYALDNWVNVKKLGLPDIRTYQRKVVPKEGFCSFVVKNAGCVERNNIFHALSQYKKVDSGGPLFNNVGYRVPQDGFNAHTAKLDFLRTRKFNLCYENSSYPGYVTEKILHAFLADTIPIYWGSPTLEMDFNMDAVICRHNFRNDRDMIEFIKQVDNNDSLYQDMMQRPILNSRNCFLSLHLFEEWFIDNVYRGNK